MLSIFETRNRRRFERPELRSSQYIFLCEHFNSLRIYYPLSRLIPHEKPEKIDDIKDS